MILRSQALARNEMQFRTELAQTLRRHGAVVFTLSGLFQAGLPDLVVQCPNRPTLFLELKHVNVEIEREDYSVDLSPTQRRNLRAITDAGGYAAWALCVRINRPLVRWALMARRMDRTATGQNLRTCAWKHDLIQERYPGQTWDAGRFLERIFS